MNPFLIPLFVLGLLAQDNSSVSEVTIYHDGGAKVLTGRVVVEAQNKGILLQTSEGRLWELQPNQISEKRLTADEFQPIDRDAYSKSLKAELGDEFKSHTAGNFVFVYNTEKAYALWVSGLYKKFERGFKGFWNKGKNKFKLNERPEFPLAVIIFKTRDEYEKYMAKDLGTVNSAMMAYYNLESNRVVMFDLTAEQLRGNGQINNRRINEVLSNPKAIHMVATIIHEGTHQLMFNYGMQTRYSDTPLWLNEGIAMFFETPDLTASRGWRQIGKPNFIRLGQFADYTNRRPDDSLKSMIESDEGFRTEGALDQYAQAWAFNYFLLKKHRKPFIEYLKFMSEKPIMKFDTKEKRVEDFQQFFDLTLQELDREFIGYFRRMNQ